MRNKSFQVLTKENLKPNPQDYPEMQGKETKREEDHQWILVKNK